MDFVVVVLGWWTEALLQLLTRRSDEVEIRFMEGPYLVRVSRASPERVRLECVEAGLRSRVVHVGFADAGELVDSLLRASRETLDVCAGRGWSSADVEALRSSLAALDDAAALRRA